MILIRHFNSRNVEMIERGWMEMSMVLDKFCNRKAL